MNNRTDAEVERARARAGVVIAWVIVSGAAGLVLFQLHTALFHRLSAIFSTIPTN